MAKYKYLKIACDACCHIPNAHVANRAGKGKAAAGVVFLDDKAATVNEFGVYLGDLTVPQAEYKALTQALDTASGICRGDLDVWMDSELVVKQMKGDYGIKSENIKPLYDEVKRLENRFAKVRYFHHGRNAALAKRADQLAETEYKKHQS
jgi:ribonuclease HI